MIKLSRLDVEIIFLVARYKKGYMGEVWHMTGPKSPSTWWSAQREIPRLLDVHAAADQRVCSPLNKTAFLRSATLLIEEISFYFIYGHNVRGGFLPSLPLRHFYWPSRISIIYFKPRFARTWNPDSKKLWKLSIVLTLKFYSNETRGRVYSHLQERDIKFEVKQFYFRRCWEQEI